MPLKFHFGSAMGPWRTCATRLRYAEKRYLLIILLLLSVAASTDAPLTPILPDDATRIAIMLLASTYFSTFDWTRIPATNSIAVCDGK